MDKVHDDEIDILSLFQTLWEGKWKIASIMAISLLSVFGFNTVLPNTTFNAQTEIKPITSFEFDKYRLFNATGVFKVKKDETYFLYTLKK
jgi:LPS O-antigen subunit length determinant protein (WzzB/FepE family)